MLPQLQRIAAQAAANSECIFTNLAHLIDKGLLRRAYELTRKDGAVGVDGQEGKAVRGEPGSEPGRPPPAAEGVSLSSPLHQTGLASQGWLGAATHWHHHV